MNETHPISDTALQAIHKSLQDGLDYAKRSLGRFNRLQEFPIYKPQMDRIRQDIADMEDAIELIPKSALKD